MAKGKYAKKRIRKQLRGVAIRNCGLSAHTVKALEAVEIKDMTELITRSEAELKAIHGIGEKAMEEIKALISRTVMPTI